MTTKKIEAIYPLSFMQQSLLVHSLKEKVDQGFLQVKCTIVGDLSLDYLEQSWREILQQHAALKSSIHWENLEKSIQVVHSEVSFPWEFMDWTDLNSSAQEKSLSEFLKLDQKKRFSLSKAPMFRIAIIRISNTEHLLIWTCHHILLDGWSFGLILQNVFECYHQLCQGLKYYPKTIANYQQYLNWRETVDDDQLAEFWINYLKNFKNPTIVGDPTKRNYGDNTVYQDCVISFSRQETTQLKADLNHFKVTISNFMLSVWSVLLSGMTGQKDVVFGTTVSGRSIDLPGIENMTGLFTNVVPVRMQLDHDQSLNTWLTSVQKAQVAASNFEFASLDQISSWIKWPGHQPLFNSLIVVENFPMAELKAGEVEVKNIQSGVTTTYPLNIIINPKSEFEIIIRYDSHTIDDKLVLWMKEQFRNLILVFADKELQTIEELNQVIPAAPNNLVKPGKNDTSISNLKIRAVPGEKNNYLPPTNTIELQLTKIWEEVLGLHPISVKDDFFEIGGKSLQAVRLFYEIDKQLGRNLSPSTLMENPTIESLAKVWNQSNKESSWSSLVPMRAGGSKPPIFAIHGGGGYVFFYQPMTKYLDSEQPVYALQPLGLDGEETKHESIEAMAEHYLKVIHSICPEGPFSILGTCLSDPICVEMNNQMRQKGKSPIAAFIVDSSPYHLFPRKKIKTPKDVRVNRFKERFKQSPFGALRKGVVERISRRLKPVRFKWEELEIRCGTDKQAKNLLLMQKQLQKLYYDYEWAPFDGKITLIKTSENEERINNWDEGVWEKLALSGVDKLVTPGYHHTRFEEPDVIELSKRLQKYLDQLYEKQGINPEET